MKYCHGRNQCFHSSASTNESSSVKFAVHAFSSFMHCQAIDTHERHGNAMALRLLLLSALIAFIKCAPGVAKVQLHASQFQTRADTSNTTQNAIDFLLTLNYTLIKYDSEPLVTLPGVSDSPSGDAEQKNETRPDTVETRSTKPDPLSHVVSKRVALPAAIVNMPFVPHNVHLSLGASRAGSWMADIPTAFDTGARVYSVPSIYCTEEQGCRGATKVSGPESDRFDLWAKHRICSVPREWQGHRK